MTHQGKNLEKAIKEFIEYIGEDTSRDGLLETPKRFVKQFLESTVGYQDNPEQHLKIFASESDRDLVTVKDITFSSLCEHHLVPFFGTIDISYVPNGNILGLSKFARVIDAYSKRLQVQERLTQQVSDLLEKHLQPKFLVVRVAAKHTCMSSRGVKRHRSTTITTAVRGDIETYSKVLAIAESKVL